jgi:hypothetical protein
MATRVGIELAPDACRIIEIDAGPLWARRRETRVRSFAVLPPSGAETQARLRTLRKRRAAVVVWAEADHRQVVVSSGSYESMRAEALASLAAAGLQTRGVWADIAPASPLTARAARRPVVVALASGTQLTAALQPLRDAGIRLRAVTTPAVALASLARSRRDFSAPNALEIYAALEEHVTCVAMIRGGVLLTARDFPWGYIDEIGAGTEPRSRDDITTRLVEAISDFLAAIGGEPRDIGQLCICGGLPELRSMTALLMERLDVEVEPLDSLFGIDAAQLPDPVDEFMERGAEMRLAWAVAADWPPAINLLRARRRQVSKTVLARAAVATGVAAGLVVGWRVQQSQWWRARAPRLVSRDASNIRPAGPAGNPAPSAPNRTPAVTPPAVATRPPAATTSPGVTTRPPAVASPPAVSPPPPVVTLPPAVATRPPVVTPPPAAATRPPVVTPPPAVTTRPPVVTPPPAVVTRPPVVTPPPAVATRPPVAPPPAAVATRPPVVTPPPAAATRPPAVPPPPAIATRPPVVTPSAAVATRPLVTPPPVVPTRPPLATPPAAASRPPVVPLPSVDATRPPVGTPAAAPPSAAAAPGSSPPAPPRTAPAPPPEPARVPAPIAPVAPAERVAERASPMARRLEQASTRERVRPSPAEAALPFDAVLGTILYSADRKLAIVDGRIVGLGDEIRGARIVDITPNAVTLRDGQGRLRRLGLGAGGR